MAFSRASILPRIALNLSPIARYPAATPSVTPATFSIRPFPYSPIFFSISSYCPFSISFIRVSTESTLDTKVYDVSLRFYLSESKSLAKEED